jgi:PAS domain S-box-containing protein
VPRWPRSLRGKTLFIIVITVFALVGGLYALARVVLVRGYSSLEADFAHQDIDRVSSTLANEIAMLDRTNADYSSWDATYAFLQGKRPNYPKSEFPPSALSGLRVNFAVILDNQGRPVLSYGYNFITRKEAPLPQDLAEHLRPGSPLATHHDPSSKLSGILTLKSGPVLIDSLPVLTSASEGPVIGTFILGRSLDLNEVHRLAEVTRLSLEVEPIDAIASRHGPAFAAAISKPNAVQLEVEGDELNAYRELTDLDAKPGTVLRVTIPREIYKQGQTTLLQFLLLLLAAGSVFGAVTLYLLERAVLSRVAGLSERVTEIGASGDLSGRVPVIGQDELSFLGTAINGMLEDLERAQTERQEGRARLAMVIEKMPAVLWTADNDMRFTSCLGAGLDHLGLRTNQLVGSTVYDYFRGDDPDFPPLAAHRKALAGESVTFELDWQKRGFEAHVQPLRDSDGQVTGVIGLALDITERKQLADQLRQSQKMQAIGQLAGGVAHDFNNLLMVVKGHAEMLLGQLPDSSRLRNNAEQIDRATDRAASLTRQLLAFSRMQVLRPRVLDLNEVVGGMTKMFSRVMGENIDMVFVPGAKLGRVKADPGQMEQVLLNLVVNARDAIAKDGRITIETSNVYLDRDYSAKHHNIEPGHWVMLTVSDTGCGMDEQTQSRIFEPFFTTKAQGKGTGLGLATVYGVVKQSGGFIYVYSEVGHGTTFKIYLPQVTAGVDKEAADKTVVPPPRGSETILFVEDEESVRELVRDYLSAAGYKVLEAADGMQALEIAAARTSAIDILVTDVVMPRLSGRELASRLTSERPGLKVLFISGYTDDSIFRSGVLAGGVAYLQKPFNLKTLARRIREVLDGVPATVEVD